MIDLSDWQEEYAAALKEGDHYCKARAKGIPEDRWTTTEGQHKIARLIEMQTAILYAQAHEILRLQEAEVQRGLEAMKMEGE